MMYTQLICRGRTACAVLAALALGGLASSSARADGYTVVVGGLHSPRGLTFGPGGRLYVAEAGDPERGSAIDEVLNPTSDHASLRTVVAGLPSGESVGVDGISAIGNGTIYGIIGESEESNGPCFGHLIKVNVAGGVRDVANVGSVDYAFTGTHPELDPGGQFPDANPYGVLALPGHIYVADAGANTLDEVSPSGKVTILAYFQNTSTSDAVPTSIAQGPDGALYIGILASLGGGVYGPAKIYRIDPAELTPGTVPIIGDEHLWATGLRPVQGLAFGPDGSLYVSELFVQGPVGDVVKIPFNDPSTHISMTGATLAFPGGITVAADGTVYVVGGAVFPNGFVARLTEK